MEKKKKNWRETIIWIQYTTLILFLSLLPSSLSQDTPQNFIVHVSNPHSPDQYTSILSSLPPPHQIKKLLYTYKNNFHGFAARLTETQASFLRHVPGILKVYRERIGHLNTIRTPEFLGLSDSSGLWPNLDYGDDVIIGLLDTGIWPESRSYNDDGYSPIPDKWKGGCVSGADFLNISACNKKLIGAKFFSSAYEAKYGAIDGSGGESRSPRDTIGHGTHTSSTAGGSIVKNVNFYDVARGESRGVASKARLAMYKVCWKKECSGADVLAGIDTAIHDGVDVISISVGFKGSLEYDNDEFAIGAFGAVSKGIIVVSAAGNSGTNEKALENIAPWILTVGASSIDRDFRDDVVLGDGSVFRGISLYSGDAIIRSDLPLVLGINHGHRLCVAGRMKNLEGKIVLCDGGITTNFQKANAVKQAGGVGVIIVSDVGTGPGGPANVHYFPTTMVDPAAGNKIRDYVNSQPSAKATIIFRGMVNGGNPVIQAPQVAQFSSRGPNIITPEILKPDVIAPGVNIFASWTGANSPSETPEDTRRVEFNFQSGTSMAVPHVSGLAALLRKAHPGWSPAAIKSALMTTAYNVDNTGSTIKDFITGTSSTPFDRGSGHVDPNKALDPGLVYDLGVQDYIGFLCSIGYNEDRIATIVKDRSTDCSKMGLASPGDLNYPSFSIVFKPDSNSITHKRVVKNVGEIEDVVYDVKVFSPPSINTVVSPDRLAFSPRDRSLSYEVTFSVSADEMEQRWPQFGWIEWSDGFHNVGSPIAFTLSKTDSEM